MNRQPLNNYRDHDLDRRVVSPDGLTAVVWVCKRHVKRPSKWNPQLVDADTGEARVLVTISSNRYFFTAITWNNNDCYPARLRDIERDNVAVIQRLFDFWQAVKK